MHKHKHKHCTHTNLKYCSVCDVAYCTDCGKEWVPEYWTYTYPYSTYISTGTPISWHSH